MKNLLPMMRLPLLPEAFDAMKENPSYQAEAIVRYTSASLAYWTAAPIGALVRIQRGLTRCYQYRRLEDILRSSGAFKLVLGPAE